LTSCCLLLVNHTLDEAALIVTWAGLVWQYVFCLFSFPEKHSPGFHLHFRFAPYTFLHLSLPVCAQAAGGVEPLRSANRFYEGIGWL
ncbi:MAG: hypothetical protein ACKOC5_04115, partial [Chloroflexota bacterium]